MEFLSSSENQNTIEKLQKGLGKSYDLFIYGDKKAGIKPGNIRVYGTIAGQREVLRSRKKLQAQLLEEEDQREM